MSEEIALAQADADRTVAAIRARWAGIVWHYAQNSLSERYIGDAWIYDTTQRALIDLDEPSESEVAFLRLVAQAPSDIQALLAEIDRAKTARDAWREIGAQSAEALAEIEFARVECDNPHELGLDVMEILGRQPPRTRALLGLVSAAVRYRDAVQAVNGIADAETALLAAAAAWQGAIDGGD
jgi:hypothetical protein